MVIAIDGPAGTGKSTVSRLLAQSLGITHLDSGALYRALAFYGFSLYGNALHRNRAEYAEHLAREPQSITVALAGGKMIVYINGCEVEAELRTPEITEQTKHLVDHPFFRSFVNDILQKIAVEHAIIVDGRDIGSMVFPNADYKFYLDATVQVRTARRSQELGIVLFGEQYEALKQSIQERDERDRSRQLAPLCQAADAQYVDTSELSIEEVVAVLRQQITA